MPAREFLAAPLGLLLGLGCACGRSALISVGADGGGEVSADAAESDGPTNCSRSTCENGCCASDGTCRGGQDASACGSLGGVCLDCVPLGFQTCDPISRLCSNQEASGCGPDNCSGCCDGTTCFLGNAAAECGIGGGACQHCPGNGVSCTEGSCGLVSLGCSPSNCGGCCSGNTCLGGNTSTACGLGGAACQNCAADAAPCVGGSCGQGPPGCSALNCGGCCDGNSCQSGVGATVCGAVGEPCFDCSLPGEMCVPQRDGGVCQLSTPCGPQNCQTCCAGTVCVAPEGIGNTVCGSFGSQCQDCSAAGEFCDPGPSGGICNGGSCNLSNCNGCCQEDICVTGLSAGACGSGGQLCGDCSQPNENCIPASGGAFQQGGVCVMSGCSQANCTGCCEGSACRAGTEASACGALGQACIDCSSPTVVCVAGDSGTGGTCESVQQCNPQTCPKGCCVGDVCAVGTQDEDCGTGGLACQSCSAPSEVCSGQVCVPAQ
jgi:hypothetical protein